MQEQLEKLSVLEERVNRAIDVVRNLRTENKKLQEENGQLLKQQAVLERRIEALEEEKQEFLREGQDFRAKAEQWSQYEKDREEIRLRIDQMLTKFEELEI